MSEQGQLVVKPSGRALVSYLIGGLGLFSVGLFVRFTYFTATGQWTPWMAVFAAVILLAAMSLVLSYMWVAKLVVDSDSLTYAGFFGRTRRWDRSALGGIAFRDVASRSGPKGVPQAIFFGAADHRILVRLSRKLWTEASLTQVAARLGIPVDSATVTKAELAREFGS